MKFYAYAALVASVSAHEQGVLDYKPHPHPHPTPTPPTPSHHGELVRDVRELDHDLKELDFDLREMMHRHHRHERPHHGGGGDHHRHHGGGGDHHRHHKRERHHKKHEKEEGAWKMPTQEVMFQHKFDNLKLDIIELEQIVDGVLRGATNAEGFNDIAKCVTDLENVLGDANTAVKDFKAGGATNVVAGLKAMGDLIKQVQAGMQDCSSTQADWARLKAMAEVISSPTSFVYHVGKDLLINGQEIYGEINTAITDYDKQDWEGFGFNVGKAAAKTILGQEEVTAVDCRATYKAQSACDANAACSWCTSAAVASACNTLEDAKKLPAAVFHCDKVAEATLFLH